MKFKQMKSPENGLKPNFSGLILARRDDFTVTNTSPLITVFIDKRKFIFNILI